MSTTKACARMQRLSTSAPKGSSHRRPSGGSVGIRTRSCGPTRSGAKWKIASRSEATGGNQPEPLRSPGSHFGWFFHGVTRAVGGGRRQRVRCRSPAGNSRVASVVAIPSNTNQSFRNDREPDRALALRGDRPTGKRRRTTYWMTMQEAREQYLDPVPVPDSLEIREVDDDSQRLRIK